MNSYIDLKFDKKNIKGERDKYNDTFGGEGFVYLIQHGNKVKVGSSRGPIVRIQGLLTSAGIMECEAYVSVRTKFYRQIEKHIHYELRELKAIGEWFFTSADQVIKSYPRVKINHTRGLFQHIETIKKLEFEDGMK